LVFLILSLSDLCYDICFLQRWEEDSHQETW